MAAASSDPMLESLQRLQPKLDDFNKSLSELCRANSNKPETLALRNGIQEYYSMLHKDLLSRYELLKLKEKNQNAVKNVPKIEPEMKQPKKEEEEKKEAKKEGEDDFGGYSIPKILPIKVRPKILAFCRNSSGEGLLKYLINNRKDHALFRDQLPAALSKVIDGASVVLKAIEGYDFSQSGSRLNDSMESVNRRTCISLLECLFPVLGSNENAPVAKEVQDKAREMAMVWRKKMGFEKSLESASKLDMQAFLQLLVTFRIGKDFEQNELCEILLQIVCLSESPALALFLGLSPKISDFVDKLSKNGKWTEAIRYAHAFGIMDKVKLTDLLKAYLEDTEKAVKEMVLKGAGSTSSLLDSTRREIDTIIRVIKFVKEYKLEEMFPLDDLQNKLQRLHQVRKVRTGKLERKLKRQRHKVNKKAAADKAGKDAGVDRTEKRAAASTSEKKMMLTTLEKEKKAAEAKVNKKAAADKAGKDASVDRTEERAAASTSEKKMMLTTLEKEKKAAEAKSDKKSDAIERERLKRPRSSEPLRGNVEFLGTQGPADLKLYRLSQRVKYDSEQEMNSTAGDKEKVPHSAGLFRSNDGIYRDDLYLSSYHGDNRSALRSSMYGSGHTGSFVTPSPTVTQTNERRGSDSYPTASGFSNINPVGPSFYGTSAIAGARAVSSAQVNYDGRVLQSYKPTFGGVDKSSLGSSTYDIGAAGNSSGSLLKSKYERVPESNTSNLGGDNLNISSSMYGSNWSSDPNNWNDRRGHHQYMLNLESGNMLCGDTSVYGSGASAVSSSNVYGSGLEEQNSGFASTRSNYRSVASSAGVSGQSAINRYQFNSGLRF